MTLGQKFRDIGEALSDLKFARFLVLLGLFFWLPFWAFFNLCALYVDAQPRHRPALPRHSRGVFGTGLAGFLSHAGRGRRAAGPGGDHLPHRLHHHDPAGLRLADLEKLKAMPSFMVGLVVAAVGFVVLGYAPACRSRSLVFLGIFFFAVGEMIASPRIQEYITWIAPKEKAGLYMGANFLAVGIGGVHERRHLHRRSTAASTDLGHPEYVWYVLAAHFVLAIVVLNLFVRLFGEFREQEA